MAECGPPDCEAQKKKINGVISKALKKGDTWYLVDIKWFKQWKKYVGYDSWDTYSVGEESAHPGPIDNMALYKEESSKVLREGLIDDLDYFLVPEEGWKDLLDWYGLVEGQGPVCRKVIEQGMFVKHCKVEVYLLDLKLSQNSDPNTNVTKQFSRADTIEMLEKEARKVFSIPAEKEVRLWNRYMSNTYEHLSKPENTLQDAGLYQGQVIVIEQKNDDGTWPRQAKSTSTYSISTRSVGYGGSGSHDSGYSSSYYNNYEPAKAPGTPGLCGLANLGNTCFMNSALQCMSNVPVLTNYMLSKKWESELNEENPLGNKGEIAKSYAELVKTIWSGRYSYTVPRNFKVAVGKFAPQFSGYQQQDSQELMAFLLDGLHEDLNRIRKKPYIELKDADGRPDALVARETWANYQKRNDSVIVDIFHGLLKSTVQCPDCAKISVTFDPFCYLSLPLPIKKERQMEMFWVPLNPELHPVQDLEEEERNFRSRGGGAESPELAEELLPENHALCPVKLKVTVPKTGCVLDLCKALSALVDVPPENMMVTDVYNHRFHKLFTPDDGLSHILDRDDIFVYEIPTPSPNIQIVPVYLKEKRTTSGYAGTSQLFGQPFLLPVDKTTCTYEDVYLRILHRMSRYVRTPEPEDKWWLEDGGEKSSQSEDTPQEDGEVQCNGDVVMEGASDDELEVDRPAAMEEGEKPRRLFALQAINSYGNNDGTHRYLPDDGSLLKFSSRTYLAIEWDPIGKKRFFDDKASEVFTEHESLKAKNHQRKQMLTLKDCLNLFLESEKLGEHDPWYCPQCKEHKQATKKFDLWDLPSILIIHLKRFSYSRYWRDKIDVVVDCPLTGLDMEKFSINPAVGKSVYDLIAVSNHYGGLGGGHYTACGKNKDTNKWYYFDDSSVTATDEESIVTKAAYVLVYQKRGLDVEESGKICSASASAAPATESRAQASNGYSTEEDQGVQDMDTN